jgi:hypothetical protein
MSIEKFGSRHKSRSLPKTHCDSGIAIPVASCGVTIPLNPFHFRGTRALSHSPPISASPQISALRYLPVRLTSAASWTHHSPANLSHKNPLHHCTNFSLPSAKKPPSKHIQNAAPSRPPARNLPVPRNRPEFGLYSQQSVCTVVYCDCEGLVYQWRKN